MSAYYEFYAEVKIGNTWHSINPVVTRIDGTTRAVPIMSGGSMLFDTYNVLSNYGHIVVPDDLSNETQRLLCCGHLFDDTVKDGNECLTAKDYYCTGEGIWVCNFDRVVKDKLVPGRRYRNAGYVLRDVTQAVECREVSPDDEIEFLTQEEYDRLGHLDKRKYVWYEWNYPWDTYGQLSNLNERISNMISWLNDTFYDDDMNDTVSYKDFHSLEVRVIAKASW